MINSKMRDMGYIELPNMTIKEPMIPFDLKTLDGLCGSLKSIAGNMVKHLKVREGMAFFTVHGRYIEKGATLRRGGAHTDGNYMNYIKGVPFASFGGNGFKLGENGPLLTDQRHIDSYENEKGGIILASTYSSSKGYIGQFSGSPNRGGDCTHIELNEGINLEPNKIYYGNNRFIHESLPMNESSHRTMFRVTLPITHEFEEVS